MRNRSAFSSRRALLVLGALAGAGFAGAQSENGPRSVLERQHRAETRARYAQLTWERGVLRGGLRNELALPGWRGGALRSEHGLLIRTFQHGAEEAAPSFVLETCVADSVAQAQECLVDWLAGVQSSQTMPSLADVGLSLGEAGFVGRAGAGPSTLAWIVFVRGNVAVRVSACDPVREPDLDLAAIATAVDLEIQRAPALASGALPVRPRIERLALPRASATAGDVLRIDLSIADPPRGEPHLQWIVGGPGQGYVERDAHGDWQLHTTGPGTITLAVEVTGSTGTWARSEVVLNVLDD